MTEILLTHPRIMRQTVHLLYAFMPDMRRMAYGKTARIEAAELDEVTAFLRDLRFAEPQLFEVGQM